MKKCSWPTRRRFVTNPDKNPTLTIMALSWRTSEYLLDQAQERRVYEPWMRVSRRSRLEVADASALWRDSVLRVIPLEAAEHAHHMIERKRRTPNGRLHAEVLRRARYKTLQSLCETILPADADSGGAIEAGAPEFIDLLTSENDHYQAVLGWRTEVARSRRARPLQQGLPGLRAGTAEGNSRQDRLSKERGHEDESLNERGRILLVPAQHDRRRILHQQDRDQVPRIQGQYVPDGVPGMPAGAGSLISLWGRSCSS